MLIIINIANVFLDEIKKKSAENERRKREALTEEFDDDGKEQALREKGVEDEDEAPLNIKDLMKKGKDFADKNYNTYITKKKPKAKEGK